MTAAIPSFESFANALFQELGVPLRAARETRLDPSSGFDSLALFEMYALIVERYGVDIADTLADGFTCGDAYEAIVHAVIDARPTAG